MINTQFLDIPAQAPNLSAPKTLDFGIKFRLRIIKLEIIRSIGSGFFRSICHPLCKTANKAKKSVVEGKGIIGKKLEGLSVKAVVKVATLFVIAVSNANATTPTGKGCYNISIPPSSAAEAINRLAKQTGAKFLFPYDLVQSHQARAVIGCYTLGIALDIMLKDSGLESGLSKEGLLMISKKKSSVLAHENKEGKDMKSKTFKQKISAAFLSIFAASGVQEVGAQDHQAVPENRLEELIVTAQKRSESIQDIPIAMTAFTGNTINQLGFNRADDIAKLSPNLQWKPAGGVGSNVFLRGIGDNSFQTNQVGAVGIYVDEVSTNSPVTSLFSLFDLERVEVLRGPQNTLYGRNTTGGAINYISNKPDLDAETNGHLEFTYGRFDQIDVDGAVGFPLGEKTAARVAFISQNRDGVIRNRLLGTDDSDIEKLAGRAQVLFEPNDDLKLLFSVHGGINRGESRRYKSIGQLDPDTNDQCPAALLPGNGCVDMFGFSDTSDYWEGSSNLPSPLEDIDAYGVALHIERSWNNVTLTSITSFETNEVKRNEDADAGPSNIFEFHQQSEADQWSQEFRLASASDGPLNWIAGLYLSSEDLDSSVATALRFVPAFPGGVGGSTQIEQEDDAWSVYGQTTYELSGQLTLTAGLRYSWEEKQGFNDAFRHNAGSVVPVGGFIGEADVRANPIVAFPRAEFGEIWREWGGQISLDYQVNDDALIYASISRGFKGGGVNFGAQQAFSGFGSFAVDPEFLLTYEIGAKTTWLENSLQLNAALFQNDFKDQQVFQSFMGTPLLTNAANSTIRGAEIDLTWLPTEGLYISLGVGLLDAEFDSFDAGNGQDFSGNSLVQSPDVNFSGLIRQEWNLAGGVFALQTDFNYIGDHTFSVGNEARLEEEAYWTLNARGSYEFGLDGKYKVAIWGKNILDEDYCAERIDLFAGLVQCVAGDPATYGFSASLDF